MNRILLPLALLLGAFALPSFGAIMTFEFDRPEDEARFKQLSEELRCLVCQNQSLADSNADLAQDLRRQTYEMIRAGKSDEEIVAFMVARYGDFVLYRPPVKPATYLLWVGPLLLLLAGAAALVVLVRRRSEVQTDAPLSGDEQRRLQQLLTTQPKEKRE